MIEEFPQSGYANALTTVIRFVLTFDMTSSATESIAGSTTKLITSEIGTFTAVRGITRPSPFANWANQNEIFMETGAEDNAKGVPYALLYAFDLPPTTTKLPTKIKYGSTPHFSINLPESGLKLPIQVQMTSDLANPNWKSVPETYFNNGMHSLVTGSVGEIQIEMPDTCPVFFRLSIVL